VAVPPSPEYGCWKHKRPQAIPRPEPARSDIRRRSRTGMRGPPLCCQTIFPFPFPRGTLRAPCDWQVFWLGIHPPENAFPQPALQWLPSALLRPPLQRRGRPGITPGSLFHLPCLERCDQRYMLYLGEYYTTIYRRQGITRMRTSDRPSRPVWYVRHRDGTVRSAHRFVPGFCPSE
jgi:hypothetical protein